MQIFKKIIIIFIIIILTPVKLSAVTNIIYCCKNYNGKIGYYDLPCLSNGFKLNQVEETVFFVNRNKFKSPYIIKQTVSVQPLISSCKKIDCQKVKDQIIILQKLLQENINNKKIAVKIKQKIYRYNALKKKICLNSNLISHEKK
jgi:hypothetical protein